MDGNVGGERAMWVGEGQCLWEGQCGWGRTMWVGEGLSNATNIKNIHKTEIIVAENYYDVSESYSDTLS